MAAVGSIESQNPIVILVFGKRSHCRSSRIILLKKSLEDIRPSSAIAQVLIRTVPIAI
jgi:hypothetical protein